MEEFGLGVTASPLPADPDRAHRLVGGAAARAGDAGDRHRNAGARRHQRARHHLHHRFTADRAVFGERLGTHAQQRLLGLVAVGRHAAVEPGRTARDVGDGLGDPAAGAAFGGRKHQVAGLERHADLFGQGMQQIVFGQRSGIHAPSVVGAGRSGYPKEPAGGPLDIFVYTCNLNPRLQA